MIKTVHSAVIESLCSGAVDKGLDRNWLLNQIGLPQPLVNDPKGRIPVQAMSELTKLIRLTLKDESLGFLEQPLKPNTHQYACHSSISSRNIREVFHRMAGFFALVTDDITFSLIEERDTATLMIDYPNPRQLDAIIFISFTVLTFHRWVNWLSGKKLMLNSLSLNFQRPIYADEYKAMFQCEHLFNQPTTGITFDRRFLDNPVTQTADNLEALLPSFPNDTVQPFKLDNSLSEQVRRILQSGHEIQDLMLTEVADQLHTSTDTLRRKLKEEGNSFVEIKENVRRNSAMFWLANSHSPINSIALNMGFSEPSAFNRAFKNWTGQTPGEYRKLHR